MKRAPFVFAYALILGLIVLGLLMMTASAPATASGRLGGPAKASSPWVLNDLEYFERPGVSVLVFHDNYPEGRQGGLEIIQHGERVAALGDVRLEAVPGQWGQISAAGKRLVDRAANRAEVPARFEKAGIAYRVRVEPDGEALLVTVDLDKPLPRAFAGLASFNLELFPPAYFGKSFHLGRTDGAFPRQPDGPTEVRAGAVSARPLAEGAVFTAAAEDPLRRLTVESLTGPLRFSDGRNTDTHGWYLLRSLIPAGASRGAVRWRITPNAVESWRRPPVIGLSQVGYHPAQEKRAVIELDPRAGTLPAAVLLKIDPVKGPAPVLEAPVKRWGRFLRYDYAVFDFSTVREPGGYIVRFGEAESSPFVIAADVYRRDVWQPTLETFLPVQMCHVRVVDRGRIWHNACHLDDALARESLETAVGIWDYEQANPPVRARVAYVPDRVDIQEVLAAAELLITTKKAVYASRLEALLPVIEEQVDEVGWTAARALPFVRGGAYAKRLAAALSAYAAKLETELAQMPHGVPWHPQVWGVTWDIQDYAVKQYYLHLAFPKEFDRENVLRVVNYILGCHPASNTSLVSAVGAKSMTVAYGINLNDWTHIPGGGVSGPSLIRPDFPELKEPWPYLWQQAEYVLTGATTYVFAVLAADRLLNGRN